MKPVTVSIEVPNPPHQVYEFLEVLGNHEQFMDHFMVDWELSGPRRGVGAKANVRVKATTEKDWTDVEIVEADAGRRLAQVGGGDRRRLERKAAHPRHLQPRGPAGRRNPHQVRARVRRASDRERLMGPLQRAYVRRVNRKGMKRLAEELAPI
jgi:hypothetical protein